jgi:glycosyltransferase involved in cell wall biosynthesis/SAM-dependent methyltransferase
MHQSALKYGKLFFEKYLQDRTSEQLLIVDVGAQDVNGSLKQFSPINANYVGVDFAKGKGVDIVITDPYNLPFETGTVDAVVCSSVFEHSEFFWLLFQECLRITKPNGLVYVNAPSNGMVHRYPIDGWRFYPDAGHSLVNWAKKHGENPILLESFIAPKLGALDGEGMWNDFVAVFVKHETHAKKYLTRIIDNETEATGAYAFNRELQQTSNQFSPDTTQLVAQQAEVGRLRNEVVVERTKTDRLTNELVAEQAEAGRLTSELASEKAEIDQLKSELASEQAEVSRLRHDMSAIKHSRSWRYTIGLRAVGHIARNLRKFYRFTNHAINVHGGYLGLTRKVISVGRRDGLKGIFRSMPGFSAQPPVTTESGAVVDRNDYQTWIKLYDSFDKQAIESIKTDIDSFTRKPKISVVMPVYNAPLNFLEEAINSVLDQLYDNWELCIADDASTNKDIRPLLESYARQDARIKVAFRAENGHISAASNSALALATGEFIALLDNDDLLPIHALYRVAKSIINNPEVALIYSDEDKIDINGIRHDPYFKCDWNPDLLYSQNMFSHLGVYQHSLLNEIGGFRLGLEGSQDYDIILRCSEHVNANQILHLPYILYHWRVHPDSTAMSADAKPYAMIAGERAINEHFIRTGVNGSVELIGFGYKASYEIPVPEPLVSIIIPTRNAEKLVRQCINSIRNLTSYVNYEILLIDNGSDDLESLHAWKVLEKNGVRVFRENSPFNYSLLNNLAVSHAKGEIIALVNNDIEVIEPKWLETMVSHALRPGIGAVGARLLYPNKTIQHSGVILGMGGAAGHVHYKFPDSSKGYFGRIALTSSFSAVTAACMVVRRDLYLQVGGLDEVNLKVAFNDIDFCLRLNEAGLRNVYAADAILFHHESASRGAENDPIKLARFNAETVWMQNRWGNLIKNDPYYSPNLTLDYADCSLAWPPRTQRL